MTLSTLYVVSSAPFLALHTLLDLDNFDANKFSEAIEVVRNNVYVDDIIVSGEKINQSCTLKL